MKSSLATFANEIDRALRGQYTTRDSLREGKIQVSVQRLTQATVVLGMLYGLCMGLFPLMRGADGSTAQLLSTTMKVPLLFLLTLLVTFPSLYVFSALTGSRLNAGATLRLLIIAIAINMAVLAGFGPVTAFFVLCTDSYAFIKVLNILMFGIAGVISLVFLRRTLSHVFEAPAHRPTRGPGPVPPAEIGEGTESLPIRATVAAPQKSDSKSRQIFGIWIFVYGVVGAQMSWVMRPFIGSPNKEFELFRTRESNFFHDLFKTLGELIS